MYERVKILQPILDAAVAARPNKSWPAFDGTSLDRRQFVSASEIGRCAREIWFSKNLPLIEGKTFHWGYAERGHSHEAWIVEQLNEYQHEYDWAYIGKDQVSFYVDAQSGTPDGIMSRPGQRLLVDFKSIDPRSKVSALPKKEHIDQVIQNMDIVEHCLELPFDGALLAYSDASDYSKVTEYLIDRHSPQVGERMIYLEARAQKIMTATSADQLPAEGMYAGKCTHCPFKAECNGAVEQQRMEKLRNDKSKRTASAIFG